jgi:hypothetical protein
MGYLEAPLSLNPSDREPKTTIVARVMLATVLITVAIERRKPAPEALAEITTGRQEFSGFH